MKARAKVVKIFGENIAEISVVRQSACGENCHSCKGCSGMEISAVAKNLINAKVGDFVDVESKTSRVFFTALLVYILPIILFFVGYGMTEIISNNEVLKIVIGALFFTVSIMIAILYAKKTKKEINVFITNK